jgi:hypothetical protein
MCKLYFLDSNPSVYAGCNVTAQHTNGPSHIGPRTTSCIAAFVDFATKAMLRYSSLSLPPIFELWNEPNTVFWGSDSGNTTQYAALATALRKRMSDVGLSKNVSLVGPALSGFGSTSTWTFLQALDATGTLALFDHISLHPYRVGPPETVLSDYARLRSKEFTGVKGIVSGEWGWSTCNQGGQGANCPPQARANETTAAKYLARSWLVNAMSGELTAPRSS